MVVYERKHMYVELALEVVLVFILISAECIHYI